MLDVSELLRSTNCSYQIARESLQALSTIQCNWI